MLPGRQKIVLGDEPGVLRIDAFTQLEFCAGFLGLWDGSDLCRQNRVKEGLEQFDAALKLPLYTTPQIALENAGSCALEAAMIRPAEAYFMRLVQIQPFSSRGYQGLAAIALKTARLDEARKQVRMGLSAQPQTPELFFYGACAEKRLGDRAAEDSYTQQLKSRYANSPLNVQLAKGGCE